MERDALHIDDVPFVFSAERPSYDTAAVFCVRIDPEIEGSDDLLKMLCYSLWFPPYFGFNWNALDECLRNLEWIPDRKIAIVHHAIPDLPAPDKLTYLQVMRDAVRDWQFRPGQKALEVVFPTICEDEVRRLLAG